MAGEAIFKVSVDAGTPIARVMEAVSAELAAGTPREDLMNALVNVAAFMIAGNTSAAGRAAQCRDIARQLPELVDALVCARQRQGIPDAADPARPTVNATGHA